MNLWDAYKAFNVLHMQEKKTRLLLAFATGWLTQNNRGTRAFIYCNTGALELRTKTVFFNYGSGEIKSFLIQGY